MNMNEQNGMPHVCGDEPPRISTRTRLTGRMPHVCGDEPLNPDRIGVHTLYAPRMWG